MNTQTKTITHFLHGFAIFCALYSTPAIAQPASVTVLGVWDDTLLKCSVSIEEKAGNYTVVTRACKMFPGEVMTNKLVKLSSKSFREIKTPRPTWHYVVGTSGDLEVWDKDGPVRTMTSTAPKTEAQAVAQKKTEAKIEVLDKKMQGVSVGMTVGDVLSSSWGKPSKINKTTTANGVQEQWVYSSGYLYFTNGQLKAIQN